MINLDVDIYCKIYTDSFPSVSGKMSPGELFEYLLSDCKNSYIDNDTLIEGDKIIWYLGCNEKFGEIQIQTEDGKMFERKWGFGESSFKNVEDFVYFCRGHNIFTYDQFVTLLETINEGKQINSMYLIPEYLQCKKEGKPWTKNGDDEGMRKGIKDMMTSVKKHLNEKGIILLKPLRSKKNEYET